jgi:NitT/TauT family transport system ATP-binding protein
MAAAPLAEGGDQKMNQPIIQAMGVTKTFGKGRRALTAVEDFDLLVNSREVVTLVGPSGCGKSTVLNMVAGFMPPSSGRILLEGTPVTKVEPHCGMIFQTYALFPWMTVQENVEFGPRVNRLPKSERLKRAGQYIEMVGLVGFENAYPNQLSGGMRQRVALCRALANEPEVLLCDEPFAALDAMTRQVMQEELLRIVDQSGQTVLYNTHSIDEALILSDRIVVMSARPGRVKKVIENHLPRPRHVDVQLGEDFLRMKRVIWKLVEEEVVASMGYGN